MSYVDSRILEALKRAFIHHWHLEMAEITRDLDQWPHDIAFVKPDQLLVALADALAIGRADGLFHEHALDDVEARIELVLVSSGLKPPKPTEET